MRPSQPKFLFALAAALGISAAAVAKWEPVAIVKGERIELDKARIVRQSEGKTTAWSRLALDRDFIDEYGLRYTAIEALNRYDCENHRFTTVKRIYSRDGNTVREEKVANPREMTAEAGSADALLLAEACKARTVGEGQSIAEKATRAATETREGKPKVMYADMRTADGPSAAKPRQVADKAAATKPADKNTEAPREPATETKSGERPRFIELPKIDKSQFEEAAKTAAKKPADAKATAKPVASRTDNPVQAPVAVRHELERQYATSGPRKSVRKKSDADMAVQEHRTIHWSYEGEGGPANWSKLRPDYAACASGRRQSPIDLRESIKVDLESVKFNYMLTQFTIVDNGHTIQVNVGEGSFMRVMEREFQLVQFHFHRPSEERIGGHSFDMVVHLVHKDIDGRLAVLAVLLERGSEHPVIQALWNNMPLEQNQELTPAVAIDLSQLLPPPEKRAYYTYMGSLTTPPCTEDVLWMVFKQPLQVSSQQIGIFSRLYNGNARPLQPANGRLVKESR